MCKRWVRLFIPLHFICVYWLHKLKACRVYNWPCNSPWVTSRQHRCHNRIYIEFTFHVHLPDVVSFRAIVTLVTYDIANIIWDLFWSSMKLLMHTHINAILVSLWVALCIHCLHQLSRPNMVLSSIYMPQRKEEVSQCWTKYLTVFYHPYGSVWWCLNSLFSYICYIVV